MAKRIKRGENLPPEFLEIQVFNNFIYLKLIDKNKIYS